jgi:hypothetical protein
MNFANLTLADLAGMFLGLLLTLFIFSYIFGDNALFRLAIHIFIGAASGFAAVVAVYNVIWPQLIRPLLAGSPQERLLLIVPLLLSLLLLTKASQRLAVLGSPVVAFLVGVGAATAIGGALLGTLFPQARATINLFDLQAMRQNGGLLPQMANAGVVLLGAVCTLAYFHFGAKPQPEGHAQRPAPVEALAWVGRIFIAVTFGALFAGTYSAALTALIERLRFVADFLLPMLTP